MGAGSSARAEKAIHFKVISPTSVFQRNISQSNCQLNENKPTTRTLTGLFHDITRITSAVSQIHFCTFVLSLGSTHLHFCLDLIFVFILPVTLVALFDIFDQDLKCLSIIAHSDEKFQSQQTITVKQFMQHLIDN